MAGAFPLAFVLSWQPTRFEAAAAVAAWEQTLERLRALGYQGVELAVRDPAAVPARRCGPSSRATGWRCRRWAPARPGWRRGSR